MEQSPNVDKVIGELEKMSTHEDADKIIAMLEKMSDAEVFDVINKCLDRGILDAWDMRGIIGRGGGYVV